MRRKLVVGNWKMHGSAVENQHRLQALVAGFPTVGDVDVAVCVPFPYLAQARDALVATPVAWGAQALNEHAQGAHTGEVSAAMLKDFSCRYVIVGHSERRAMYGEDDARVAARFVAAREGGLSPILCVGETLAEREAGLTEGVVVGQLKAVLARAGVSAFVDAVVAYEPVWAIGTGMTATPEQAGQVHALIRACVAALDERVAADLPILYGGSVKRGNARELFAQADIDGGLVGGASLDMDEFLAICRSANR